MTAGAEEGSEVESINASIVVLVNGAESRESRVVIADFEVMLEGIKTTLQVNFLLDNVEERVLNVVREGVEATNTVRGAVEGHIAEEVVLARQEHLQVTIKKKKKVSFTL